MNLKSSRSIDGLKPRQPSATMPGQRITSDSASAHNRRAHSQPPPKQRRSLPEWLQMPLIIAGAMIFGVLVQNAIAGQLAIIAYGVAAVAFSIASRVSFILALLAMCATILLLVFKGDVIMSQNFAIYTFLFMVVGVITLNRELKKEGGRIYSIKKTHN